ncbi:MAG TPA: hypothetical protein P5161_03445 [Eubacteriales bacterium]|nr:hypothetical protein [Clostridia bacterium]HRR89812.1 hypothetical protein [Eubacteriales bacterium]HRU84115.1 hypothetical protein [Eubacteriales bacterium]
MAALYVIGALTVILAVPFSLEIKFYVDISRKLFIFSVSVAKIKLFTGEIKEADGKFALHHRKKVMHFGQEEPKYLKASFLPIIRSMTLSKLRLAVLYGAATPDKTALSAAMLRFGLNHIMNSDTVKRGDYALIESWSKTAFILGGSATVRYPLFWWLIKLLDIERVEKSRSADKVSA